MTGIMLECERIGVCAPRAEVHVALQGSALLCRELYCAGNRFACARFRAYDRIPATDVPDDLKPHDHARLRELLPL